MPNNTPLRYPGGKSKITNFISDIMLANDIKGGNYVEPFAGGCGVALNVLYAGLVNDIYINDKDRSIYAFWHSVITQNERFVEKLENIDITIAEWQKQRSIQKEKESAELFELGFSTFFLNRTNRSGIIKAGVIGGIKQLGKWRLDARFNKDKLKNKITHIKKYKENIHLYNMDAVDFMDTVVSKLDVKNTLVYLDPPYYVKGGQLYMNYLKHDDHVNIFNSINKLEQLWLVSYDNQKEIQEIYKGVKNITYMLRYTAGTKHHGCEIMFASDNLIMENKGLVIHKAM